MGREKRVCGDGRGKGSVKKRRTVEWEIIDGEMEKGDELCTGRNCVEEVRWRECHTSTAT